MKKEILEKIQALGGDTSKVTEKSLKEDLCAIEFKTVLYEKPTDTPWSYAEEEEPIYGISEFIDENMDLFFKDKEKFFEKIFEKYFTLTEEPYGQYFWLGKEFTPFKEGTDDFEEWNDWFLNETDLEIVFKEVETKNSNFIHLFYSYGYPDGLYFFGR